LILRGLILAGDELEPISGYVSVESGKITEVSEGDPGHPPDLILPSLINSHVHTGDYMFRDIGMELDLNELVRSPDGLKHRLLSQASPEKIARGISAASDEMVENGTTSFLDFREQGMGGVSTFRMARIKIRGLAFGRPTGESEGIGEEVSEIARLADGIGLERAGAYTDEDLSSIRAATPKDIAIHVFEARNKPGEMARVLDVLSADILVHLTHSSEDDLRSAADRGCRAVVCPRANLHLGVGIPPIDSIIDEVGVVGLGSDNCMINSPNLFRDMEVAHAITKRKRPRDVLKMATVNGAKVLGISEEVGSIEVGKRADMTILRPGRNLLEVNDVHAAVVKRAGPLNISLVLRDGRPIFGRRPR
jgi:cytosine/adenosine deaminase-related metal-dependent hydrolase